MKAIINKKSYWGRYEFRATSNGKKIHIEVFSNVPAKYEFSFEVSSKEELIKISLSVLNHYTGKLDGNMSKRVKSITPKSHKEFFTTVYTPAIDHFIESFRYDI